MRGGRATIPDPRAPKKLATIKATAYHWDQPDLRILARAIVDHVQEQVKNDRAA